MRARSLPLLLALASLALACPRLPFPSSDVPGGGATTGEPLSEDFVGEGTYYAATGAGNCSFDPSPGDLAVAALNDPQWENSAWCGACAEVEGPDGSIVVRIVDRCPECRPGDLDLSREAFSQIAALEQGRVPITWRFVACDVEGPVRYRYQEGSSQWWTSIQVRNHALPISRVELLQEGGFVELPRRSYNYFVLEGGAGPDPLRVRVTARGGQTREDDLPPVQAGLEVSGAGPLE